MAYIPTIDEYSCAAHGDCAALAPGTFEVDDVARVTGAGSDELILKAARACPAAAIAVIDSETGEQIYP